MSRIPCHSERSEESLINWIGRRAIGRERPLKAWPDAWHFVAALRSK
jgi:hypothetical protein